MEKIQWCGAACIILSQVLLAVGLDVALFAIIIGFLLFIEPIGMRDTVYILFGAVLGTLGLLHAVKWLI